MLNSDEGDKGVSECPNDFYRNWVNNSKQAQSEVEKLTRETIGTAECPIPGLPHEETLV